MSYQFTNSPAPEPEEPSREDLYEAAVRAVLDLCDAADRAGAFLLPGGYPSKPVEAREIRAAIASALQPRAGEVSRAARDRAGVRAVLELCDRLDEVPGVGFGSTLTGAIRAALVKAWEGLEAEATDAADPAPVVVRGLRNKAIHEIPDQGPAGGGLLGPAGISVQISSAVPRDNVVLATHAAIRNAARRGAIQ